MSAPNLALLQPLRDGQGWGRLHRAMIGAYIQVFQIISRLQYILMPQHYYTLCNLTRTIMWYLGLLQCRLGRHWCKYCIWPVIFVWNHTFLCLLYTVCWGSWLLTFHNYSAKIIASFIGCTLLLFHFISVNLYFFYVMFSHKVRQLLEDVRFPSQEEREKKKTWQICNRLMLKLRYIQYNLWKIIILEPWFEFLRI